ncbi:MAG TPA: gamma-glutamylcyclotransferase family protein [Gemmataceae bacterium]|nr:gamma-glutamylcyclotransferase family protein [Gemmataceae bacterium]
MTMGKTALFVYGTLKRGFSNHAMLAGQEFVGAARTLPRYRLLDHGPHPCLVEAVQAGRSIRGEIWNVDAATLDRLDEFEEVDHLFSRREIALVDTSTTVYAYFYRGDATGLPDCLDWWSEPEASAGR